MAARGLALTAASDKTKRRGTMAEQYLKHLTKLTARRSQCGFGDLLVIVVLCISSAPTLGVTFSASLDRDSVLVGESVSLTLKCEGGSLKAIPPLPRVPGVQFTQNVSSSMNSSLGPDGKMTSVNSYTLSFVALQPGEVVIPPIAAEIEGQKFTSQPLRLKVLQSDPSAPPVDLATNLAFLWLVLPKQEVYVGEIVVAELRLYLRSEVANIANAQIPNLSGEGFNVGERVNGQQFQRRLGNSSFTILPLVSTVSPVKSGVLTVAPIEGSVTVLGGQRDLFGGYRQRGQVTLRNEAQTFRALPLPTQNVPPSFNGAVGSYTMTVNAGPTNVATGDPITVRVQIAGRGSLQALTLPEQTAWHDFKTYPPTSDVQTSDPLGLQGVKTFEQIVVPQSSDIKELPSLTFAFFDPEAKAYRTLTQPAIQLVVRPGGGTPAPVIAVAKNPANENPPPPQQDIVPIKQRMGTLAQIGVPLVHQPWFLALQSVPVLAWVVARVWRKRVDALANNPRLRRQRQVAQIVRDGFNELRKLAAANDSDQFFALMFRLLQEQLGERLDCAASSITESVIDEKLRPRGVGDSTATALHELFQTCNLARYAPIKTTQELTALIGKLEGAIRELQRIKA
jgi:hypothetical protein